MLILSSMLLDVIVVLLIAAWGYLGFRKGFMQSLIGFTSTSVSLIFAIALAKPFSKLLDLMKLSKAIGTDGKGTFALLLISAAILFIIAKVAFWYISKLAGKWKEKSPATKHVDSTLGILFGVAKMLFTVFAVLGIFYIMSWMPGLNKAISWLLKGSHVAKWFYDIMARVITSLIGRI